MKKRRFGQISDDFEFHDGSWKKWAEWFYMIKNKYAIAPSEVLIHIIDFSMYPLCHREH